MRNSIRLLFALSLLLFTLSLATCFFGVRHEINKIPIDTRARIGDTDWVGVEWILRGLFIFIAAGLTGFASLTLWVIQRRPSSHQSMRSRHLLKTLTLTIILVPLVAPVVARRAQTHNQQQQLMERGPLPKSVEALVIHKKGVIDKELAITTGYPVSDWAGTYSSQDGLTAGTQLSWAPVAGFLVRWSTCSHGWKDMINYGTAVFADGELKLTAELSEPGGKIYSISPRLIPVLWGKQHYLIPSERLINFCYAARNADNSPEVEEFFLKEGDREKARKDLPGVPPEYKRYLSTKPIVAVLTEVKSGSKPWIRLLTLSVGRAEGVVKGMKFYALSPRNVHMLVEVMEVGEHSAEAYVITSGYRSNSEREVKPRIGWRLTSRAPADASNYYPR